MTDQPVSTESESLDLRAAKHVIMTLEAEIATLEAEVQRLRWIDNSKPMTLTYMFDQDPRYGWANIDIGESNDALIVIDSAEHGSLGFQFRDGKIVPTCICHAYDQSECACPNVDWTDI